MESKHRHDFVQCDCPLETFVDGGNDYVRTGGMDLTKIKFWNEEKGEFCPLDFGGQG